MVYYQDWHFIQKVVREILLQQIGGSGPYDAGYEIIDDNNVTLNEEDSEFGGSNRSNGLIEAFWMEK